MELSPEDAKLVTLARASRARTDADQGAAVRDLDGRTYTAATVTLTSLHVEALDLAIAMAASSGAKGIEAAAVVGADGTHVEALSVLDLGGEGIDVYIADPAGQVASVIRT